MKKILLLSLLSVLFVRSYAQQITFTPQWMPQSQFAGYYAALENGFEENHIKNYWCPIKFHQLNISCE